MIVWTEPALATFGVTHSTISTYSDSQIVSGQTVNDSTTSNETTNRTTSTQEVSTSGVSDFTLRVVNQIGTFASTVSSLATFYSFSGTTTAMETRASASSTVGTDTFTVNSSSFTFSDSSSDSTSGETVESTTAQTLRGSFSDQETSSTYTTGVAASTTTLVSQTATGWAASSSGSSVSFYTVESTVTQISDITTTQGITLTEVVTVSAPTYLSNAANTVYRAENEEALWVGSSLRPSAYSDSATAAGTTTTQTTIGHAFSAVALSLFEQSQSTLTATVRASSSQSISWIRSTAVSTTETYVADIYAYPPTSTRTGTTFGTTGASTSGSTSQSVESDRFGFLTMTEFASSTVTVGKWTRGISYQTTSAVGFTITTLEPLTTYETSAFSSTQSIETDSFSTENITVGGATTSGSGETTGATGSTLSEDTRFVAIVARDYSTNNLYGRIANFPAGFFDGSSAGGWPTVTAHQPPFSYVLAASGLSTVWPQEASNLTVSSNSWSLVSGTTVVTGTIGVSGSTSVATRAAERTLGGSPGASQTMLETASAGAFQNETGGTTFFDGSDTTYSTSRPINHWYGAPFYSASLAGPGDRVIARRRNWTEI